MPQAHILANSVCQAFDCFYSLHSARASWSERNNRQEIHYRVKKLSSKLSIWEGEFQDTTHLVSCHMAVSGWLSLVKTYTKCTGKVQLFWFFKCFLSQSKFALSPGKTRREGGSSSNNSAKKRTITTWKTPKGRGSIRVLFFSQWDSVSKQFIFVLL